MLDIDRIIAREPLLGRLPATITWSPDGTRFLYTLPGGDEREPLDVHERNALDGSDRIIFRARALGKGARPVSEFVWSPDSRQLAYLDRGALYVMPAGGGARTRVAADGDDPQWSPRGDRLAYVRDGDLYTAARDGTTVERLTRDGAASRVDGDPDWVYSEELDMRHAYRWSPDGTRIAYLRFDDRPVTAFPIVDFLAPDNRVTPQRYPLAGERNPDVSLVVLERRTGARRVRYATAQSGGYIAAIEWSPQGRLFAELLDRAQKRMRLEDFGAAGEGTARDAYVERDAAWVETTPDLHFLADGRIAWRGERDGRFALSLVDPARGTSRKISGGVTVLDVLGVDDAAHAVYASVALPTRRDRGLAAFAFDGARRSLTSGRGTHLVHLAPRSAGGSRFYVDAFSGLDHPPVVSLVRTGGASRVLARSRPLDTGGVALPHLLSVPSRFGPLDAWMILPPDFDPHRRYPAIVYVYGGPAAPTTRDMWDGPPELYHLALAQRGFVVFSVDGPASQIDSSANVRRLSHALGPASLAGQIEGARYLRSLPYVDPGRIGIWGWSFGGYETTYALTHAPQYFRTGVAVAPVTDWRFYDTIYTERYMGRPQDDPRAYRASSVLPRVGAMRGHLLVSHGTGDDNVHIANTVSLIEAAIGAGKQLDLMVYPRKSHGIPGIADQRHLFTHMLDYWSAHL